MADIDSINQQFIRYDQVRKAHTYRLAEHPDDAFDDDYEIAILDLEPFLNGDAAGKEHAVEELAAEAGALPRLGDVLPEVVADDERHRNLVHRLQVLRGGEGDDREGRQRDEQAEEEHGLAEDVEYRRALDHAAKPHL